MYIYIYIQFDKYSNENRLQHQKLNEFQINKIQTFKLEYFNKIQTNCNHCRFKFIRHIYFHFYKHLSSILNF